MTLGSLFDGIGVWQLAATNVGIKPVWSSEIEKFPLSVTARRFPETIQLGDVNLIDAEKIPPVDIVTASSPCQDISIAGKQRGIHGERSCLFFKAVELVRRINAEFFIWENVPNVLNIRGGADFAAVLSEITATDVPIPEHGFANAGVVDFDGGQLAWRICDAQHWGLAQRRKRVFIVTDFRSRRAAKILFEPKSLQRDSAPCTGEKQNSAAGIGSRADFTVYCIQGNTIDRQLKNGANGKGVNVDVCFTLNTVDRHAVAVYENHGQDSRIRRCDDVAPTMNAKYVTGDNNVPLVAYGIGRDAFNQGANAQFKPTILYDICPPIMARGASAVATRNFVRRLTPTECERLQGIPDNWTAGGSDAARYKALGNALALPVAEWILKRIKEVTS